MDFLKNKKRSFTFLLYFFVILFYYVNSYAQGSFFCKETNFISITPGKKSMFSSSKKMIVKVDNSPDKKTALIFIPKNGSAIIHGNNRSGQFKQIGHHSQYIEVRPGGYANLWSFFPAKNNKLNKNILILEKAFEELNTPFAFIYVFECKKRA